MRTSKIERNTLETKISLALGLDGTGEVKVDTGVGFMDHMLTLFAVHGCFDLDVKCQGDTYVDDHHSVEDIGIALGEAFRNALGDFRGITRYADIILPMDEALIMAAVDISNRGMLILDLPLPASKVGSFDTELVEEFLNAFARNSGVTLHIRLITGHNTHHIIEAVFKALGRIMSRASAIDVRNKEKIPSSKGVL